MRGLGRGSAPCGFRRSAEAGSAGGGARRPAPAWVRVAALVCVLVLGAAGCAPGAGPGPVGATPAERPSPVRGPEEAVTRFLEAAGRGDHWAMAGLFGTAEGALGEAAEGGAGCALRRLGSWIGAGDPCPSRADVLRRMALIAAVLERASLLAIRRGPPDGSGETVRLLADLDVAGRSVPALPVVVVRTGAGAWLVQEIALGRLLLD